MKVSQLIAIFVSTSVTWPESRRPKSNHVIPGATALIAIGCGAAVAGSDFHFLRSWFSLGNWFCGRGRFWLNLGEPFRNDSIRHTFSYASRMFVSRFSLVVEVEKKT
ncbi:MAG: hypothetical protein ABF384_13260 [Verrucomicrobiales bacterium]